MALLFGAVIFAIVLFLLCYQRDVKFFDKYIAVIFGATLVLRIALAFWTPGHGTDMMCFGSWAARIFEVGPAAFYSPDHFTDYPPGYIYLLWPIGAIASLLNLEFLSGAHVLLLKMPSLICDMVCGWLLWKEGQKYVTKSKALLLTCTYLFNPVILLNSVIWGQVDSVFTLLLFLVCLALMKKKLFRAYLFFGIGILIKPQMLVFTPVLIAGILDEVIYKDFTVKKFLKNLAQGISVLAGMVVACIPFGLSTIIAQYSDTLGSYPYASVNAYNFYSMLGLNWADQNTELCGIPLKAWGMLVILSIVFFCLFLSKKWGERTEKYPLLCAFSIITMFTFSVRMHERYIYPAMLCLLFAYIVSNKPAYYRSYGMFSVLSFLNAAHVLYFYDPYAYNAKSVMMFAVSIGMVWATVYFYYTLKGAKTSLAGAEKEQKKYEFQPLSAFGKDSSMKKADYIVLLSIMVLYSGFALYDLGDNKAPETFYSMETDDVLTFTFRQGNVPNRLSYYIAPWQDRHFAFTVDNGRVEYDCGETLLGSVFTWQEVDLPMSTIEGISAGADGKVDSDVMITLRFRLKDIDAKLIEFVFMDEADNVIMPENAAEYAALFDEQELHPERSSFRNSMIFDEIYHGRTAYEFVNELDTYETTHPPLGKVFISLGIALFGMNPFGWRIVGTIFGVLMLPILYLFAKRMTGHTPISAVACLAFAFDFMHFTQSRIATIDVYITFFVILMYYLMYCYLTTNVEQESKKGYFFLGACGVAMGMGVASKWTGVYAGIGLALVFFVGLYVWYRKKQINLSHIYKTIGFCMIFFVVVPVCIYVLSYLPFRAYNNPDSGLLQRMWDNQLYIFGYHSDLNATHYFATPWYEWPLMKSPIWYYSGELENGLREGISAFGNPLVWWVGIPAAVYMVYRLIAKKDTTAGFLLLAYMAQYLPWVFVSRITFIYHYFPSVPFVVLMIAYSLLQMKNNMSKKQFMTLLIGYGCAVFMLFMLFYPVISGQPVDSAFVEKYLKWFDSWVLIS